MKWRENAAKIMDKGTPHIEVRAVDVNDAPALHELDYNFETDRIYALREQNRLVQNEHTVNDKCALNFTFELVETQIDPPIYKNYWSNEHALADLEVELQTSEGGFVALADGVIVGGIWLGVEEWRSVARIQGVIIGRQFRRFGIGSLLLSCVTDWARNRKCWALELETQNTNYPAIQFYLRNSMEIWGIDRCFYPPGDLAHEVAIVMGKRLSLAQVE